MLLLVGCAREAPVSAPPDLASLTARLPASIGTFERRADIAVSGDREIAYATPGPVGAAATVELGAPDPAAAAGPDGAALAALVAGATAPTPPRRLAETGRLMVPDAAAPLLGCAALAGRLGRERVEQLVCAGRIAGAPVRLRIAMPAREPPVADAAGFARAVAVALAGP